MEISIEAGSDASPILEAAEHSLNDVALFVDGLVVIILGFAVFARWDDRLRAARFEPFSQGLAVVTLVGNQLGGGRQGLDTTRSDPAIMQVSWCQEQDARPAFLVADGMELGVASAFRAADTMSQGPPFPPPAQR